MQPTSNLLWSRAPKGRLQSLDVSYFASKWNWVKKIYARCHKENVNRNYEKYSKQDISNRVTVLVHRDVAQNMRPGEAYLSIA